MRDTLCSACEDVASSFQRCYIKVRYCNNMFPFPSHPMKAEVLVPVLSCGALSRLFLQFHTVEK